MGGMTETRRLLLIRHAEAGLAPGKGDHARPLSPHGCAQADTIGHLIAAGGLPRPEVVHASDATRTLQTWQRIAAAAGIQPDLHAEHALYGAEVDDLVETVQGTPDAVGVVALVGHAPEVPGLAFSLVDALAERPQGWPAGCVGVAEWDGSWADFGEQARLVGYFRTDL